MDLTKINYKTFCTGMIKDRITWVIIINDEKFDYFTGLGYLKLRSEVKKSGMKSSDYVPIKFESSYALEKALSKRPNSIKFMDTAVAPNPKIEDVLNCLFLDSQAHDYSFENWCSDFGYDTDSIKAKKIYDACNENYFKLKNALKNDFDEIKTHIESLEL